MGFFCETVDHKGRTLGETPLCVQEGGAQLLAQHLGAVRAVGLAEPWETTGCFRPVCLRRNSNAQGPHLLMPRASSLRLCPACGQDQGGQKCGRPVSRTPAAPGSRRQDWGAGPAGGPGGCDQASLFCPRGCSKPVLSAVLGGTDLWQTRALFLGSRLCTSARSRRRKLSHQKAAASPF